MGLLGFGVSQQVRDEIAAADTLWESDQREQAVSKYKSVIDKHGNFVEDARPYERIIEFEAGRGNREVARKYADLAVGKFADVSPDSYAAAAIVEEARASRWEPIAERGRFSTTNGNTEDPEREGMLGDPVAEWPTASSGVKAGPYYSKDELTAIAGRIIQNGIGPGWELSRVIGILGKPTNVSRSDGYMGMGPDEIREFKNNPLIPPDVKEHLSRVQEICTWSFADEPASHFIMLNFVDGRLQTDGIVIRLP
jgi:hypothetical protein